MKHFSPVIMACALAVHAFAQDAATNTPSAAITAPVASFKASAATLTAPLALTNDYIYLPGDQADVGSGGKAVFNFNITNAGNYVIETVVNAPDESSNSFFLNIDALPEDPDMIWDIPVTSGFETNVVSWRGNGDSGSDQFTPKRFKLDAGKHDLIIIGREPGTLLKTVDIRPAPPE